MSRPAKLLTKADESAIIDSYCNGTSLTALVKTWHVDVRRIRRLLIANNVRIRTIGQHYRNRYKSCGDNCTLDWSCVNCRKLSGKRAGLKKFGLTVEAYNLLLEKQNGACAVCFTKPVTQALSVDHDHRTGKVRGLLCQSCNVGIGFLKDDARLMRNAADYIESRGN